MARRTWVLMALLAFVAGGSALAAEVTIDTGPNGLPETPLAFHPDPGPAPRQEARLVATEGGITLPAQWEQDGDTWRLWTVAGPLPPNRKLAFRVEPVVSEPPSAEGPGVFLRAIEGGVEVLIDGKLFTRYVTSDAAKPYCYPLIGPGGVGVTRGYPVVKDIPGESKDHEHHQSLFFTFGAVNGIDFWSLGRGRIVHRAFTRMVSGPVFGLLEAQNDWIAPDGKKVCTDTRVLRIFRTRGIRVLDYGVRVQATEGPVEFGDTKEGMFGIRVVDTMKVDKPGAGTIVNSRGQQNAEAWGQRAEWCDYSGPVGDRIEGIAVLDSPRSFRYPTNWHVRTYGLFAANPFGLKDFFQDATQDGSSTLQPGEEMPFRYRIVIHPGPAGSARVPELFALWTQAEVVATPAPAH